MAETKAAIVRDLIKKNPAAGPTAIVELAQAKHKGMKLSPSEVSNLKSALRATGERHGAAAAPTAKKAKPGRKAKKRGRPKGSRNKAARPTDSMIRLEGITKLKEAIDSLGSKDLVRQLLDVL